MNRTMPPLAAMKHQCATAVCGVRRWRSRRRRESTRRYKMTLSSLLKVAYGALTNLEVQRGLHPVETLPLCCTIKPQDKDVARYLSDGVDHALWRLDARHIRSGGAAAARQTLSL